MIAEEMLVNTKFEPKPCLTFNCQETEEIISIVTDAKEGSGWGAGRTEGLNSPAGTSRMGVEVRMTAQVS